MIVGIITGTYSSVFIAAAIVLIWQGKKPMKEMKDPGASVSSGARRPTRRRAS
jgi:preprotein translocase subunit SecF